MKRYWLTGFLAVFSFVIWSGFYVKDVLSEEAGPEIQIETVYGDETELENIILHGDYFAENQTYSFFIEDGETMYLDDLGYFERQDGMQSNSIKRLVSDYRHFMRGKIQNPSLFFEDDAAIYYVGAPYLSYDSYELTVTILDKASRKSQSFKVEVPENSRSAYMDILNVQVVDDIIHVFLKSDEDGFGAINHLEIDYEKESISHSESIIESDRGTNHSSYLLNDYDDIGANDFLIFNQEESKWIEETESEEIISYDLIVYQVATGEQHAVDLSDAVSTIDQIPYGQYSIKDDELYLIVQDQTGILVETYHLAEREFAEPTRIELAADNEVIVNAVGIEDRLYITVDEEGAKQGRKLFIVQMTSGDIYYEAEIKATFKGKEILQMDYHLFIVVKK